MQQIGDGELYLRTLRQKTRPKSSYLRRKKNESIIDQVRQMRVRHNEFIETCQLPLSYKEGAPTPEIEVERSSLSDLLSELKPKSRRTTRARPSTSLGMRNPHANQRRQTSILKKIQTEMDQKLLESRDVSEKIQVYSDSFQAVIRQMHLYSSDIALLSERIWKEYHQIKPEMPSLPVLKKRASLKHRRSANWQDDTHRSRSSNESSEHPMESARLQKELFSKILTLKSDAVSLQRLRTVLFSDVTREFRHHSRDWTIDTSQRVMQLRDDEETRNLVDRSIILIQRNIRRHSAMKLANNIRMTRLMSLTRMDYHLQQKNEVDEGSLPTYDIGTVSNHLIRILDEMIWETKRLVRDVSVKYWKTSQQETRIRLEDEKDHAVKELKDIRESLEALCYACVVMLQGSGYKDAVESIENTLSLTKQSHRAMLSDKAELLIEALGNMVQKRNHTHDREVQTDLLEQSHQIIEASRSMVQKRNQIQTHNREVQTDLPEEVSKPPQAAETVQRDVKLTERTKQEYDQLPQNFQSVLKIVGISENSKVQADSQAKLHTLIHEFYMGKIEYDMIDDRDGIERHSLGEYIFEVLFRKYGLRKVTEQHLLNLVAGLRKLQESDVVVHLFSRFCGIAEPALPLEALDFFLFMLNHIRRTWASKSTEKKSYDAFMIAYPQAMNFCRFAATAIVQSVPVVLAEALGCNIVSTLNDLFSRISTLPETKRKKITLTSTIGPKMSVNALLTIFVDEFQRMENRVRDHFIRLFNLADQNGDGVLTLDEFSCIVQEIQPSSMNIITRMFMEAVNLSNCQDDSITPEAFFRVAKAHGFVHSSTDTQLDFPAVDEAEPTFRVVTRLRRGTIIDVLGASSNAC